MNTLVITPMFKRAYKRFCRKHRQFNSLISKTLKQLEVDHTHPTLRTHKLAGEFDGVWSCSIAYDVRLLFRIQRDEASNQLKLILIDIGNHVDVY